MSVCDALANEAALGIAPALRAVDCLANDAAAGAFGRLFGAQGALLPALTILLTLYIAFFAISLLTGRSRIGISALTPRMMTLGLVLTFATSWVAWQGVVWNLAVGAPDQLAGILLGAPGSATRLFADRLDMVFAAIQNAADAAGPAPADAKAAGSFTPANLMWLGTLLLLLGTVGVLLTTRIALAVLLATGPVFVVLALFPGTRGLFVGWLRGLVLTAITPLFVVVGGGLMLELVVPVVAGLNGDEGIGGRAAIALFLVAAVHAALMALVLRVSATIVSGWTVFGAAASDAPSGSGRSDQPGSPAMAAMADPARSTSHFSRAAGLSASAAPLMVSIEPAPPAASPADRRAGPASQGGFDPVPSMRSHALRRAQGIGSRFRTPSSRAPLARPHEMIR